MVFLVVFGCVICGALLGVGYLAVYGRHGLKAGLVELDFLMQKEAFAASDSVTANKSAKLAAKT
ncbi:MAG: hypothetical protein WC325_10545 [Candidatus Bathyarchaeia archaeon]|jgi:hypothetical protein